MNRSQSLWILLATLTFVMMSAVVKHASVYMSTPELIFARSSIGCLLVVVIAYFKGQSLRTRVFPIHAKRSIAGFISLTLFFYALPKLPLSTAQALLQTAPLFFTACCFIWLREKPPILFFVILIISFIGMLLVLQPGFAAIDLIAGCAGIGAGMGAGIAYYHIRRLGSTQESALTTVFYFSLLSTLLSLLLMLFWGGITPFSPEKLIWASIIAVTATFGQITLTRGLHHGETSLSATLMYSSVIFSGIVDYWLWGEPPRILAWGGIILILAASLLQYKIQPKFTGSNPPPPSI